MKVRIIVSSDYNELEKKFEQVVREIGEKNKGVEIVDVKMHEQYSLETDNGFISYHIFYKQRRSE